MIKKKRKSIFVRVYILFIVFLLSFFTTYAFRNDVMNFLRDQGKFDVRISSQKEKEMKDLLKGIDASSKNIRIINKAIESQFDDYYFSIFTASLISESKEETRPEAEEYFFSTNGDSPTKQAARYSSEISINFRNSDATLMLYPKFTQYYHQYRIFSLVLALLVTAFVAVIMKYESQRRKRKRIGNTFTRFRCFKKLSVNLMIVNITAGLLAFVIFMFLQQNRYAFFEFVKELGENDANFDQLAVNIQEEIKDFTMSKKNKLDTINILNQNTNDRLNLYICDNTDMYYAGQSGSAVSDLFHRGTAYDVSVVYSPAVYMYTLQFQDKTGNLTIYSYPLVNLVMPYMIAIVLIAISFWLIPLLSFIRSKVYEINVMQEDVSVLSTGDWNHAVTVFGKDEIAELGNHLNQMRHSFLENSKRESEARNANKELITSLSHDLRTPLTSLMGYLDIVKYDKCNEEQKSGYLEKSIHKVEQIRSLSDKMFEYFLIYGEEEKVELSPQSNEEWMEYVGECTNLLKQQGYHFEISLCDNQQMLSLNMPMMKRVMDNLYSNVQKYADRNESVVIMSEVKENQFRFLMSNKKREGSEEVESNHIGLKSVEKIVEMHKGEVFIQDEKEHFMIILSFPLRNLSNH